jgi:hypothetical protein
VGNASISEVGIQQNKETTRQNEKTGQMKEVTQRWADGEGYSAYGYISKRSPRDSYHTDQTPGLGS